MAQGDDTACFAERLRWSEAATSVGRQERRDMSKISLPEKEKPGARRVSGESAGKRASERAVKRKGGTAEKL